MPELARVTATPLPDHADNRDWYQLNGLDLGTSIRFDGAEFAICPDGAIVDSQGCPLVDSDWRTIAVRNSLPTR